MCKEKNIAKLAMSKINYVKRDRVTCIIQNTFKESNTMIEIYVKQTKSNEQVESQTDVRRRITSHATILQ